MVTAHRRGSRVADPDGGEGARGAEVFHETAVGAGGVAGAGGVGEGEEQVGVTQLAQGGRQGREHVRAGVDGEEMALGPDGVREFGQQSCVGGAEAAGEEEPGVGG